MRLRWSRLRKVGSPNVRDFELRRALGDQWTNVLRWVHGFDQLRDATQSSGLTVRLALAYNKSR